MVARKICYPIDEYGEKDDYERMNEIGTSNRIIAKNTILLYFRMLVTMAVSLFTSRVVLQSLGVDDYGLYQAVGGVVGFISFIRGALSAGSSRFITYKLGEGDMAALRTVFSTTLTIHVLLAIIVVVLAETVGLWFVMNKMVIPEERYSAAMLCYHLSIITAAVTITQVPYSATLIAHENMKIYAYTSLVEVALKLVIAYLLYVGTWDRLKLYAVLMLAVTVGMRLYYRLYCRRHFEEVTTRLLFDKATLREVGVFSGWNLFANCSIALNNQGILVLLNMFFPSAVVTSRAISLQVNGIVRQFVQNFRTAANPQITKRWARGDYDGSKRLLIDSARYSYFLVLIMALPIILTADKLLYLWLGNVPEYAVAFVQLAMVQSLFSVFDISLYQALYAKGRIRENALISPTLGFIAFPIVYLLFRLGYSPLILSYVAIVVAILLGLVVKPLLLVKIVGYEWRDFRALYPSCLWVTLAALPMPVLYYVMVYNNISSTILSFVTMASIACISVCVSVWIIGFPQEMRVKVLDITKRKLGISR